MSISHSFFEKTLADYFGLMDCPVYELALPFYVEESNYRLYIVNDNAGETSYRYDFEAVSDPERDKTVSRVEANGAWLVAVSTLLGTYPQLEAGGTNPSELEFHLQRRAEFKITGEDGLLSHCSPMPWSMKRSPKLIQVAAADKSVVYSQDLGHLSQLMPDDEVRIGLTEQYLRNALFLVAASHLGDNLMCASRTASPAAA